jgi:DNA-binding MarR family transcriptional regulator
MLNMANKKQKTAKQMERHFKGISNHYRIDILLLIEKEDGITVDGIAETLHCKFKTASEHAQRLVRAGLVSKTYCGRTVTHSLTPYGKSFFKFITIFSHS